MPMLHEVGPEGLDVSYREEQPGQDDRVLLFSGNRILLEVIEPGLQGLIRVPSFSDFAKRGLQTEVCRFLFRVAGEKYFLVREGEVAEGLRGLYITDEGEAPEETEETAKGTDEAESLKEARRGFLFLNIYDLRQIRPQTEAYAAATGYHLFCWYRDNHFCGRCGGKLVHRKTERALKCPDCGLTVYPRINPGVIVGVIREGSGGPQIIGTRYNPAHFSDARRTRRANANYALVAGFVEIGESPEMTVAREVMEEVGLHVKNIRPYQNQPWPFAAELLLGFVCDADPEAEIRLQEDELKEAVWLRRDELPDRSADRSLTSAIFEAFRTGEI